jgi:hydrogenase maturation protein HypF
MGIRETVNYEAQAAIELESAIDDSGRETGYAFAIREDGGGWIIDTRPLFQALAQDLREGVRAGILSHRFHLGFVDVLARVAHLVRGRTGVERICLSGGSFQNCFLSQHLQKRLEQQGFQVFTHAEVPCGDGGISLGQAMVAAHRRAGKINDK